MLYDEQQINVTTIVNILKNAFFNVYDVEDEGFKVIVDQYRIIVDFDTENKRIKLSSIDRVEDYTPNLYLKLLEAVNNSNKELVNVHSYIENYENQIFLRVDQHISYSKGLIIEQFVEILRFFDKIAVVVFRDYIAPSVEKNK
jgi:hypothetical protein